jgi:hypothetical protein
MVRVLAAMSAVDIHGSHCTEQSERWLMFGAEKLHISSALPTMSKPTSMGSAKVSPCA